MSDGKGARLRGALALRCVCVCVRKFGNGIGWFCTLSVWMGNCG